ncbi:MAG TPA: sigma-E processing peptidase SpoIIGA [Candidatus Blautia faecigallinarum]|uniref:Sigma-E processing peptidase SpoIIGA n=1 Tax=Candidatus Blautia faecigallinarum TaxID=2838488 RepID=A0A9D2DU66_9FIRM|nr:sigma-E processing peptidase SpoIIGA [Candidatus Blautia faecigallinarum]
MYHEIYIDKVFVTNLLMDYILLRLVGLLLRCRSSRRRCLGGAAAGAAFSCGVLVLTSGEQSLWALFLHTGWAIGMLRIAYRLKKGSLVVKALLALYLTAFLCGGFWEALRADKSLTIRTFLLFAAATYLGLAGAFYLWDAIRARRKNIYPVTLSYQGKVQSAYGYYDTGNLLYDPLSGEPVSIVEPECLKAVLPEEVQDKLKHLKENPGEIKSTDLMGLAPRLLPYQTVGHKGMLLAVRLDDLCIHTPGEVVHIPGPVFALSMEPSALGKEYKVLLNSRLLH